MVKEFTSTTAGKVVVGATVIAVAVVATAVTGGATAGLAGAIASGALNGAVAGAASGAAIGDSRLRLHCRKEHGRQQMVKMFLGVKYIGETIVNLRIM